VELVKLVTLLAADGPRGAVLNLDEQVVFDLGELLHGTANASPVQVHDVVSRWDEAVVSLRRMQARPAKFDARSLLAPIPTPRRDVICVGRNYREHAAEFARSGFDASHGSADDNVPSHPVLFTKLPEAVIGPNATIESHASLTSSLDYEAELAVIVGKGGRGVSRADAAEHVWGYTIINDVTARDLQRDHKQWFLGKSLDTFCPMGPYAVTADEVDADDLRVRSWVNDELRQNASTRDLIFSVPELIETLSAGISLLPADIIATGTPAGVGIGFSPPRYLKPGDRVRVEVSGLGALENVVGPANAHAKWAAQERRDE